MLIVTYGHYKYKIQISLVEDAELNELCTKLAMEKLKIIQLIFRIGLRNLFNLWK